MKVIFFDVDGTLLSHHTNQIPESTIQALDLLKEKEIGFGGVHSELPTLNDVFLEITGKELRD